MNVTNEGGALGRKSLSIDSNFGPLLKYIENPDVTDIDFNGSALWIKDIYTSKKMVNEPIVNEQWVCSLVNRIADSTGSRFNQMSPVLEVETDSLRITCVHSKNSIKGVSMCIRKTSKRPRITYESALRDNYASRPVLNFLISCVIAKMNIVVCGEPSIGKTEFAKFLCSYVPSDEKVITIEDVPEWHYKDNRPDADCIELKTSDVFGYTEAIKVCMRLNPERIMLSEVRSREAGSLIECWSTGVKGITTIHADDVSYIPERLLNMMDSVDADRLKNDIYNSLDIGVLVRKRTVYDDEKGEIIYRYIDQVGIFERKNQVNKCQCIVMDGALVQGDSNSPNAITLSSSKLKKFKFAGISSPFADPF